MSALAGDDEWHEKRREAPRDASKAIGVDQKGRPVYPDHCVVIPGTKRPDGTRRKDRRVRAEQLPDGTWKSYVPQDEVEKYEVAPGRSGPQRRLPGAAPPGAAPAEASAGPGGDKPMSKSAKKNAARKAAKEKAVSEAASAAPAAPAAAPAGAPAASEEEELQKKAKALKKKLKQVAELQTKVDGGLAPSDEQKEKLGRGDALRAELAAAEERLSRLGI